MIPVTLLIRPLLIIYIGCLTIFVPSSMARDLKSERSQAAQAEKGSLPPYIQRGNEVSARFHAFTASLTEFHRDLQSRLMKEAPDLAGQLKDKPPKVLIYGYQILPPLIADAPVTETPVRAASTSYSWVRTDKLLDTEYARLRTGRAELQKLSPHPIAEQRLYYKQLVADYRLLADNQGLIEEHILHNRLWQKRVAEDKSRFDRLTILHDAVLELQTVRDRLETETDPKTMARDRLREQELTAMIHAGRNTFYPPSFVTFKRPQADILIVQVPLYTDIVDQAYLQQWQQAIEKTWQGRVGETEVRLQVLVKPIRPRDLYRRETPPRQGDHIDISQHVARFPKDGSVLTTGADATHAVTGRSIALGPHGMSGNTLAHEFGHILGFIDGYFRGYHDLDGDGYEVVEIIVDPADIMSAPATGKVLPLHLEKLLSGSH